jgi:hypothetical protein
MSWGAYSQEIRPKTKLNKRRVSISLRGSVNVGLVDGEQTWNDRTA